MTLGEVKIFHHLLFHFIPCYDYLHHGLSLGSPYYPYPSFFSLDLLGGSEESVDNEVVPSFNESNVHANQFNEWYL